MPKRSPGSQAPDDVNTKFGLNLRSIREVADRTQIEVGQALGVSFQQIQKYENGVTSISLNRLEQLAEFLHCTMVDLLRGLDPRSLAGFAEDGQAAYVGENDIPPGARLSDEETELLEAFRRVGNPKLRRQVLLLLQAAAEETDP